MYKSRVFSFEYLYFQALLTFSGTPVFLQIWAIQVFAGSCTVQTKYSPCAKIQQISSSQL